MGFGGGQAPDRSLQKPGCAENAGFKMIENHVHQSQSVIDGLAAKLTQRVDARSAGFRDWPAGEPDGLVEDRIVERVAKAD
jgi:hypothetical protein